MSSGKTLVVGGDGKIGNAVFEYLSNKGYDISKTTRREGQTGGNTLYYDGSPDSVENIAAERPTTVVWSIGASGYALCRDRQDESYWANVTIIEEFLARVHGLANFIYFSSTAVFDSAAGIYRTDSPTAPASEYGRQKEAAEQAVQSGTANHSILRLGKVLTPCWPLLSNWKQASENHSEIQAFSNLYLSPVFTRSIARFIVSILAHGGPKVYHCSSQNNLSYFKFAHAIVEKCGGEPAIVKEALCDQEKMNDGGNGRVDIVPSPAYLEYHADPLDLPLEHWFS
jgi:dTDP-4-dehydrorhamnose reductase